MQIYEYLSKCKKDLESADSEDAKKYAFLKYHQNIVRAYITNVLVDTRGLLVYHTMGMGKSIMGVAIAFELMEKTSADVIVLLTKSLQENFKKGILKYIALRSAANPGWKYAKMDSAEINTFIAKKFSFVSMNASNMITQLSTAATRDDMRGGGNGVCENKIYGGGSVTGAKSDYLIKTLNGKCLIVDEAHNLFRAITNGSQNAKALYDIVMSSRTVKVIFLTGTPISNDPFELVPCFNMLAPYGIGSKSGEKGDSVGRNSEHKIGQNESKTLFPEVWKDFYRDFVDISAGTIKNKGKFQNRIMGLVSYVSHLSFAGNKGLSSVEFPEELPTIIEFVPMEQHQYLLYQLAREREKEEAKRGKQHPFAQTPLMQKPKSEVSSSYRQKTRQISNFCPEYFTQGDLEKKASVVFESETSETPNLENSELSSVSKDEIANNKPAPTFLDQKYSQIDVDKIPIGMIKSAKFDAILKNINNSPGNGYVYSQFVGAGGIGAFRRYLEKHGWELCDYQKKIGLTGSRTSVQNAPLIDRVVSKLKANDAPKIDEKTKELLETTKDSYPLSADNPLGEDEEEIKEELVQVDDTEHLNTIPTPIAEQEKTEGGDIPPNEISISGGGDIPPNEISISGGFPQGTFHRYGQFSPVYGVQEIESAFLEEMKKTEEDEHRQLLRYFESFPRHGKFGRAELDNANIFELTEADLNNPAGVLEGFSDEINCMGNCGNEVFSVCSIQKSMAKNESQGGEQTSVFKLFGYVYKVDNIPTSCIIVDLQHNDVQLLYIAGGREEILPMMKKLQALYIEYEREVINVITSNIIFARQEGLLKSLGFNKLSQSLWQFNLRYGVKGSAEKVKQQTDKSINSKVTNSKVLQTGPKRFAIISGEVAVEHRQQIENILNSEENKHGGIIDLVLISSTGAEGLDFKNMRHLHIMEPYWNYARLLQIGYRGNRNDSHIALEKSERNIRMYIYLAVKPMQETGPITQLEYRKMLDAATNGVGSGNGPLEEYITTDLELYITSLKDYKPIGSFLAALQEASIECAVNNADAEGGIVAHCRMCDPNNSVLFYDDLAQDMKASDPCVPVTEKKITADEITYENVVYYYVADDSSIFGYAVFLLDEKIGKYMRMPEDDPRFVKIIELLKNKK